MSGVNWSLGVMPNVGGNALAAFETGARVGSQVREAKDKRDLRKAVKAAVDNPDDPDALKAVMAINPDLGMKLEARGRDNAFRSAATDYATPEPSALSMFRGGAPNDLAGMIDPTPPNASTTLNGGNAAPTNALAAFMPGAGTEPVAQWQPPAPAQPTNPILSHVGKPASREDALFLKMFQADPKRALEMESALRDRVVDRLKDEHEGIGYGLATLAGADAQSYPARRAEVMRRLAPLKLNLEAVLPEQFPGEEALREIQMQGMALKDQIAALINADKAEAYVENIDADNERADRNTDSLIEDRDARRAESRRYHDGSLEERRASRRGRGRGRGRQPRPTATGPNGEKVEWNGKAWAPVQ